MPENTKDVFYLEEFGLDFLIEFAKLHVIEALKIASENVIIDGHPLEYELDKNSILNAYPLSNIV